MLFVLPFLGSACAAKKCDEAKQRAAAALREYVETVPWLDAERKKTIVADYEAGKRPSMLVEAGSPGYKKFQDAAREAAELCKK